MATYRDVLAALQTTTEGRIYENTNREITGQAHQDHEKEQNEVIFDNLLPLESDRYIIVRGGDEPTPEAAGDALLAAYEAAKLKVPYGEPLGSYGYRVAVIVMPGTYDIGNRSLVLDNSYIDLIGIGDVPMRNKAYYMRHLVTAPTIIGDSLTSPTVMIQGFIDNTIRGFMLMGKHGPAFGCFEAPASPEDPLVPSTHTGRMEDMVFACGTYDVPNSNYAMQPGVSYIGQYVNCHCLSEFGFGNLADITMPASDYVTGTFIRCSSGSESFPMANSSCFSGNYIGGQSSDASYGIFEDCKAFGRGWCSANSISGTFTRCTTTKQGFVAGMSMQATFIDCDVASEYDPYNEQVSFAVVASSDPAYMNAKFINCSSMEQAFHCTSSYGTVQMIVNATGCSAKRGSFSSKGAMSVQMTINADNCTAGNESFLMNGLTPSAPYMERTFSGNLVRCDAGDISFGIIQSNNGPEYADCTLSANFTDCEAKGLLLAFFIKGGKTSQITGKYTRCRGTGNAFYIETSDRMPDVGVLPTGEDAIFASTASFTDCHGAENCFIASSGTGNAIMSATFTDCTADVYSFTVGHDTPSKLGRIDGTFERCKAGDISFGGSSRGGETNITLSGTFTDCTAGVYSFGSAAKARPGYKRTGNSVLSGTFIRCAAPNSFGCNEGSPVPPTTNALSGTFRDCMMDSNGVSSTTTHTGLLYSGQFAGCSIVHNAPTARPVIQDAAFTRCDLVVPGGPFFASLQTGGGVSRFFGCNIFGPGFFATAPVNIAAAGCILEQDIIDPNITNIVATPSNAIINP